MSGSREEYNEYHESSLELAIAEEWENLPEDCKYCSQLGLYNGCRLDKFRVDAFDSDCPLDHILCKECQYYCRIVEQDGTEIDYGYCADKMTDLSLQETACCNFKEYKGEKQDVRDKTKS